jgi:prevent-host-death family protein
MTSLESLWQVQDAKARFSELLDTCLRDGPQIVTRRGQVAAVLVPAAQWQKLSEHMRPNLKQLLLTEDARTDSLVPERQPQPRRAALSFD